MTSTGVRQADLDFPSERTVVDVIGVQDGRFATSVVEQVSGDEVTLSLPLDRNSHPVRLEPGARLELVWKDRQDLLALPVEVAGLESEPEKRLRVRRTGPVVPGQRRDAVRAPLTVPVQLTHGQEHLIGTTLDLSEGGLRCVLNPHVAHPTASTASADAAADTGDAGDPAGKLSVGDRMPIVVTLDSAVVEGRAEVVRQRRREDGQTELSLRFVGLPEVTQDVIRRAVFACLRDLRLRGLI